MKMPVGLTVRPKIDLACPLGRHPLQRSVETRPALGLDLARSEAHTSELQSLMRTSYAVSCLKKNRDAKRLHRPSADAAGVNLPTMRTARRSAADLAVLQHII